MDREETAKEAMREGKQAFRDGKNQGHCPHLPGTLEYNQWHYGWRSAQHFEGNDDSCTQCT